MDPKPKLKPGTLYAGDNGRLFCGALACAGQTAHFTGRDLSGQRVQAFSARDAADFAAAGIVAKCEGCGAEAAPKERP